MLREDMPTTAERYASAIESSHLEVKAERRGDVDVIIAAGLCRESLGTDLYRLRAEWDSTRSAHHQATGNLHSARRAAKAFETAHQSDDDADLAAEILTRMRQSAADAAVTARALILIELKTLSTTKQALGLFARAHALRVKFKAPSEQVLFSIVGHALDLWLDPLCPHCGGRGSNGGYGVPAVICSHCGGSRLRSMRLGATEEQHQFGRSLLVEMDRKTARVDQLMGQYLRGQATAEPGQPLGPAERAAIDGRLADLRSAQAQED